MKALDPPSDRFDKRLNNTRYELLVSNKDAKSNHILQIPIVKTASFDSLSANSAAVESPKGSLPLSGSIVAIEDAKPKGLYNYGASTIDTDSFLPSKSRRNQIEELLETTKSADKRSPEKGGKKKENILRPPMVDRGTINLPIQKPPPLQPVGPAQLTHAAPQSPVFASKSTSSLLGNELSSSFTMPSVNLCQSSSLEHVIKVPSAVALRPKLASIDLLSAVGDEIDNETRERVASYETFLERHSTASSVSPQSRLQNSKSARSIGPTSTAAVTVGEGGFSPRPFSASVQQFDFNKMTNMEKPPSPSALDRQQRELSVQMKFAHLSASVVANDNKSKSELAGVGGSGGGAGGGSSVGNGLVKSRPQSRSKTPGARPVSVPMSTQILRLPTALSHELSVYTEGSTESLLKVSGLNEGSSLLDLKENLNMGSELEMHSILNNNMRLSSGDAHKIGQSLALRTDPTDLDAAAQRDHLPPHVQHPATAAVTSPKMQQLSPEQLQGLQQPHYQDERFQMNPQEVIYKLRGHLLNTTPFPEEVAHLSLHTKSARLPQYLRVQQAEQQARYAAKLRQLSRIQKRPDQSTSPDGRLPKGDAPKHTVNVDGRRPSEIDLVPREIDLSQFVSLDTPVSTPKRDGSIDTGNMPRVASDPVFLSKEPALSTVAESVAGASEHSRATKPAGEAAAGRAGGGRVSVKGSEENSNNKDMFHHIRQVMSDDLDTARAEEEGAGEGEGEDVLGEGSIEGSLAEGSHTSIVSQPLSRASSPGEYKRTLSLRITSNGSMVEEIKEVRGDVLQPESPHGSMNSMHSTFASSSNRIGASLTKAVTQSARALSPPTVRPQDIVGGGLGAAAAVSERTAPSLVIRGRSPKGGRNGRGKSISPQRVAYVLNKNSPSQLDSADNDDRSLHSLQSMHSLRSTATGNVSVITDDGNAASALSSYNLDLMAPAAQSPDYSRFTSTKGTEAAASSSRIIPRLEGVFGAESTSLVMSESAESVMPYQVHRKVMGWKLTSVQRRRNLVGMLDLVNARDARDARAIRKRTSSPTAGRKSRENKFAPPMQLPHSMLRTGHGQRVRVRQVPPLGAVQKQLLSIQSDQRELQMTQIMHGFNYTNTGDSSPPVSPNMQFMDSIDTGGSITRGIAQQGSRKKVGRGALSASASNVALLAMQIEDMARYLPSDSRPSSPFEN